MKKAILCSLLVLPCIAHAQLAPLVEGDYDGKGDGASLSLRTIVADSDKGTVVARASVGSQGCAGDFVGIGQIKGTTLRLTPFVKEDGAASCIVTATFDRTGKKATIAENDCMVFHGAACSFDGKLVKKR